MVNHYNFQVKINFKENKALNKKLIQRYHQDKNEEGVIKVVRWVETVCRASLLIS